MILITYFRDARHYFVFQRVNLGSYKTSCNYKELRILRWKYLIWLFLGKYLKNLLSCLTSAPSICQNVIFLAKETFLNVGPKLPHFDIFGLLWYFISAPSAPTRNFKQKSKSLNLGPKLSLLGFSTRSSKI